MYANTFEELVKIVNRGSLESLRDALKTSGIELIGKDGTTILHTAAITNNVEIVEEFLRHRRVLLLLDRQDWAGVTPLMAAVLSNSPRTVEVLCRCGANLTKTMVKTGETVLHLACHLPDTTITEILLENKPSRTFINQMDFSGDTVLSQSIRYGSLSFDLLLDAGANILVQNPDNKRTPLHLAVAYSRKSMLIKMLHPSNIYSKTFADIKDFKGETALMIAVKLDKLDFIELLTKSFDKLTGVNVIEDTSILHIAILHNRPDILRHLLYSTSLDSIDYCDDNLRTPTMYAAELDRVNCLRELIEYGANYHVKNLKTGESLLHTIAKHHSNACLPLIMDLPQISWFFVQKDYNGNTPYMTAITSGNDVFLHESFKVKNIDLTEYNNEGETATFYTIKQGFLKVLNTLMLSPKYYEFSRRTGNSLDIKDPDIIMKAEICGDIHATDVYILLRRRIKNPLVAYFPLNLLVKTKSGQNSFHACALGGNLDCLTLIYDFYHLFAPDYAVRDFDSADDFGTTPLLYASQCVNASAPCVYFLVTHGANLAATNKNGVSVIESILTYNPDAAKLFTKLLDHCVSAEKENYCSERSTIFIDYRILCPKGEEQMRVSSMLFKQVQGNDRYTVLQHPVIITFLRKKASTIEKIFYFRFISSIIVAIIISIVIPVLYIDKRNPEDRFGIPLAMVMKLICPLVVVLCILNVITKLPMVINKDLWFVDFVAIIPIFTITALFLCGKSVSFTAELSATAILSSWMSVLSFAINTYSNFNYQVAVYFRLLLSIFKRIVLLLVIIFAFALSFFCIYHNDPRFSNILVCFMYTFSVLLPGFLVDLPTFNKEYFQNTPHRFHFFIECFILGCFVTVVTIGFTNMLVGLAVRSGQALEVDGKIFQNQHITHYITELEFWFANKTYYHKAKLDNLTFMDKINRNIYINSKLNVYDEENKDVCDTATIQQLRKILFRRYQANK